MNVPLGGIIVMVVAVAAVIVLWPQAAAVVTWIMGQSGVKDVYGYKAVADRAMQISSEQVIPLVAASLILTAIYVYWRK